MTGEAGYWDSQADTFDHQPDHGLLDPQVRQAWRRLLLAELPPAPAAIADLGCGTGTLSVLLAAEGYAVTGLDFAPQMIRAARAKARAAGVSARFELSNAAAPTLPAASFDVVLARHVLWAMPDPGRGARGLAPAAAPGRRAAARRGTLVDRRRRPGRRPDRPRGRAGGAAPPRRRDHHRPRRPGPVGRPGRRRALPPYQPPLDQRISGSAGAQPSWLAQTPARQPAAADHAGQHADAGGLRPLLSPAPTNQPANQRFALLAVIR